MQEHCGQGQGQGQTAFAQSSCDSFRQSFESTSLSSLSINQSDVSCSSDYSPSMASVASVRQAIIRTRAPVSTLSEALLDPDTTLTADSHADRADQFDAHTFTTMHQHKRSKSLNSSSASSVKTYSSAMDQTLDLDALVLARPAKGQRMQSFLAPKPRIISPAPWDEDDDGEKEANDEAESRPSTSSVRSGASRIVNIARKNIVPVSVSSEKRSSEKAAKREPLATIDNGCNPTLASPHPHLSDGAPARSSKRISSLAPSIHLPSPINMARRSNLPQVDESSLGLSTPTSQASALPSSLGHSDASSSPQSVSPASLSPQSSSSPLPVCREPQSHGTPPLFGLQHDPRIRSVSSPSPSSPGMMTEKPKAEKQTVKHKKSGFLKMFSKKEGPSPPVPVLDAAFAPGSAPAPPAKPRSSKLSPKSSAAGMSISIPPASMFNAKPNTTNNNISFSASTQDWNPHHEPMKPAMVGGPVPSLNLRPVSMAFSDNFGELLSPGVPKSQFLSPPTTATFRRNDSPSSVGTSPTDSIFDRQPTHVPLSPMTPSSPQSLPSPALSSTSIPASSASMSTGGQSPVQDFRGGRIWELESLVRRLEEEVAALKMERDAIKQASHSSSCAKVCVSPFRCARCAKPCGTQTCENCGGTMTTSASSSSSVLSRSRPVNAAPDSTFRFASKG